LSLDLGGAYTSVWRRRQPPLFVLLNNVDEVAP
jgi:hypothetical protein